MEVRSEVVSVRYAPSTKKKAMERAKAAGMSLSRWAHDASLGVKICAPRPPISDAALRELSAWGNNLNQIARKLNEAGYDGLPDPTREALVCEVRAIHQFVKALAERVG